MSSVFPFILFILFITVLFVGALNQPIVDLIECVAEKKNTIPTKEGDSNNSHRQILRCDLRYLCQKHQHRLVNRNVHK